MSFIFRKNWISLLFLIIIIFVGSVSIPGINKRRYFNTISIDEIVALREMLEEKRFEELNEILEKYQKAFEKDPTDEYKVYDAYNAFYYLGPSYEKNITEWKDSFPHDYKPHLAMAQYHYGKASELKWIIWPKDKQTRDENLRIMNSHFKKSEENIRTVLKIKVDSLPAHNTLIGITNSSSFGDSESKVIKRAIEIFPYSFIIRKSSMRANQPRLGGSYAAMEKIAKDAEPFAVINPMLTSLYGFIYEYQGRNLRWKKRYNEATKLYLKALTYGELASVYEELASMNFNNLKNYDTALKYISKSIQLRPVVERYYRLRSRILFKTDNVYKAYEDMYSSVLINPHINFRIYNDNIINRRNFEIIFALREKVAKEQMKNINWVYNHNAENETKGWGANGSVKVQESVDKNHYFLIQNGDHIMQHVFLAEPTPPYALFVGRATINKIKEDMPKKSGLPVISVLIENKGGKKQNWASMHGMSASYFAKIYDNNWVPMWGIWKMPDSAIKLNFKLGQLRYRGEPIGDTEAYFDDVGLYFFNTKEEAKVFLEKHFRELGLPMSENNLLSR